MRHPFLRTELEMDDAPMSIVFLDDDEALVGSGSPWRDGGRAVIAQRRAAWLVDLADGIAVPVRLPPRDPGNPHDPQVRIMGTHAVLRVDDQIRLMDLGA